MGSGSFLELFSVGATLIDTIGNVALDATWNAMRYILPFVIYPTVIYFAKLAIRFSAERNECGSVCYTKRSNAYYERQFRQATLITWTIKVVILTFVCFDILDRVGTKTSDMLEITTIFSLGLSWSMRDWMSSMWGCFMLAFSTELSVGTKLKINDSVFLVSEPGLVFTRCAKLDTTELLYIPNATLVAGGFTILK
jgi:hypothetical protein